MVDAAPAHGADPVPAACFCVDTDLGEEALDVYGEALGCFREARSHSVISLSRMATKAWTCRMVGGAPVPSAYSRNGPAFRRSSRTRASSSDCGVLGNTASQQVHEQKSMPRSEITK